MGKKQKKMLARILVSAVLFAAGFFLPLAGWSQLVFYLAVYAIIGWDIVWKAVRNIAHGQVFDENFLMALATIGAFCLQEFPEAVEVMLFYQVGELFQSYAVGRSRQSIAALMDIRPDYANIERDGKLEQVDPDDVAVGDTIVIKAGERIPLDGVVLDGNSTVNTAALTGESLPRDVGTGSDVISGCVNQSGLLRVRVTKEFGESTVSKILDLVEIPVRKSKGGKLYYQIRALLHAGRRDRRRAAGCAPAVAWYGDVQCLGGARAYVSGHFLPVRTGYFDTAQLFWRYRRRVQTRHSCERQQLSGGACSDGNCCF